MKQINRIIDMEKKLNTSLEILQEFTIALNNYNNIQSSIKKLTKYYGSKTWRKDFDDDEKGKIPADINRGILSEDGIYNLIYENRQIALQMKSIAEKILKD